MTRTYNTHGTRNLTPPALLSLTGEGGERRPPQHDEEVPREEHPGSRDAPMGSRDEPTGARGEGPRRGVVNARKLPIAGAKLARARQLRQAATSAEERAWDLLRGRRFHGWKFRRQQVICGFIVDFYCAEHRVALELDGPIHASRQEYDEARTSILEQRGVRVLRLRNEHLSADSLAALLLPLLPRA